MAKERNKSINLYQIRYKDSMKPIDWRYYTKFYPAKTKAIQGLRLDTGLGLAVAKEAVEEIFARLERGEVEKVPANTEYDAKMYAKDLHDSASSDTSAQADLKKVGQGIGCGCIAIIYIFFRVIFNLAMPTKGKRRRRKRW